MLYRPNRRRAAAAQSELYTSPRSFGESVLHRTCNSFELEDTLTEPCAGQIQTIAYAPTLSTISELVKPDSMVTQLPISGHFSFLVLKD